VSAAALGTPQKGAFVKRPNSATRHFTLLVIALSIFVSSASAQVKAQRPPIKVQLRVSSKDAIKGEVISYISRELRQFKDVQITDDDPDWVISALAMEITSGTSNIKLGIALSVVITSPFSKAAIYNVAKTPTDQQFLELYVEGFEMVDGHWLRTGGIQDLRQVCAEIVADFDGQYLENTRKRLDRLYK
jgi:hypothetical protein